MKLWAKNTDSDQWITNFTVGKDREMDYYLAEHDVIGTLAHIQMLESIGLLEKEELVLLNQALKRIYKNIKNGDFTISPDVEDVHSQIELQLTKELGDVGKKIHSGRSRNDQVLLDLKLFYRSQIRIMIDQIHQLFTTLITLSEKHKDILMPGYTHYQIAMPSSFGLWFSAYAESLIDDVELLQTALSIINKNPLGSAAGYGSSFPLNRTMTTELLGFNSLNYNVVYAQMGRGKGEFNLASAMASVAMTLNKLAQDICLFMGQNFAFIRFPDHLTTGSSIMPHKKNPDVFELIRAHSNLIKNLPNQIAMITTNLPHGYHRDLQMIKEVFLPSFNQLNELVSISQYMLEHIEVNPSILEDEKYKYLFTVETVNKLVLEGIPFREAYKKVGLQVESGEYKADKVISHTHEGSINNLCNKEIIAQMDKLKLAESYTKIDTALQKLLAE